MIAIVAEISQQQILDLLYEVADGFDRVDAKLDENLVLLRTMKYENALGMQRFAEARSRFSEKVSPL